jgi:hypothetical protein
MERREEENGKMEITTGRWAHGQAEQNLLSNDD